MAQTATSETFPSNQPEQRPAADRGRSDTLSLPRHNWGWFLLRGVAAIALGVLAILFPFAALFAFATVFAAFVFIDGIALVVSGVRGARKRKDYWWAMIIGGLVGVAVGIVFLLWPLATTIGYAFVTLAVLAGWALVSGALQIASAIRLRKEIEGEWLMALSGALTVILAAAVLYFMVAYPGASILSVAWAIGAYALIAGVVLIVLAFKLRNRRDPERAKG